MKGLGVDKRGIFNKEIPPKIKWAPLNLGLKIHEGVQQRRISSDAKFLLYLKNQN